MMLFFVVMAGRFWKLNVIEPRDKEWLRNVRKMVDGNDHDMPEQGKYNGGQKVLFWGLVIGMVMLFSPAC
jgi:formate dehydrogenase subunit gamma